MPATAKPAGTRQSKRAKPPVLAAPAAAQSASEKAAQPGILAHAALGNFVEVYNHPPQARIELIRGGVPAKDVGRLARSMHVSKDFLIASLGIARATLNRKERASKPLSPDESERLLGIQALIGQVQLMVEQSGNPAGFDAARWVSGWLGTPLPALGGRHPASYMDTVEGQKLVSGLLAMAQTGAYA